MCLPFLQKTVTSRTSGWENSVAACFENPNYEWIAANVLLLLADLPEELLSRVLITSGRYPDLVHVLCLRGQVPEPTLKFLLNSKNAVVAAQAAIGTWWAEPRGTIRPSIAGEWRAAMLTTYGQQFWLTEVLEADKVLAFDWLVSRIEEKPTFTDYLTRKEIRAAVSALDSNQRIALLQQIESEAYLTSELLTALARADLKVCEAILSEPRFAKYHLKSTLHGHPKGLWVDKALLALSSGYSAQDIVNATVDYDSSWTGEVSNMWQGWIDDFQPLCTHCSPKIRSIAEIAVAKIQSLQAAARKSERREAVYGR